MDGIIYDFFETGKLRDAKGNKIMTMNNEYFKDIIFRDGMDFERKVIATDGNNENKYFKEYIREHGNLDMSYINSGLPNAPARKFVDLFNLPKDLYVHEEYVNNQIINQIDISTVNGIVNSFSDDIFWMTYGNPEGTAEYARVGFELHTYKYNNNGNIINISVEIYSLYKPNPNYMKDGHETRFEKFILEDVKGSFYFYSNFLYGWGDTGETIESSAKKLQNTISTWYRVMRDIALVGLLSVLVYVAIRMMISSSTDDKAKYKKMITDWATAICILFLLHYFMSLTLQISQAICDVFNASIIGEVGQDILMSSIRTKIEEGENFVQQFANIVIYLVLVILTVMFTYQYLKRFIYAAFLTMIAPLIALTYPLDKIKDGKAQAYTTWVREYMFTVLIQAVHLVVYYVLVGVSDDLLTGVNEEVYNPIYAIVAISFILPAEKFIRNMFGFNKAEAANTIGSALGGAAVMNAINKLGKNGPKGPKGNGGGDSGSSNENSKIRTANPGGTDPYDALRNKENTGARTAQGGSVGVAKSSSSNETGNANVRAQKQVNPVNKLRSTETGNSTANSEGTKRNIKNKPSGWKQVGSGVGNVAKRYVLNKNTGKKILRGGAKLAGAATLGTIGLAAGIATGEPENALAGALGGIAAGRRVGGNLVDGGANMLKGAKDGITGIKDTYKEGKYGQEEYARMKYDAEFKKTKEYKDLTSKYPGQEGNIQEFLEAGITDTSKMGTAMKNIKANKYSAQEAIAYMKLAEKCPDEILYSKESFEEYLSSRGIPEGRAEEIRKGIVDFK